MYMIEHITIYILLALGTADLNPVTIVTVE